MRATASEPVEWEPDDVLDVHVRLLDLGEAGHDTVYGWGHVQGVLGERFTGCVPEYCRSRTLSQSSLWEKYVFPLLLDGREEVRLSIFDVSGTVIFDGVWNMLSGSYDAK